MCVQHDQSWFLEDLQGWCPANHCGSCNLRVLGLSFLFLALSRTICLIYVPLIICWSASVLRLRLQSQLRRNFPGFSRFVADPAGVGWGNISVTITRLRVGLPLCAQHKYFVLLYSATSVCCEQVASPLVWWPRLWCDVLKAFKFGCVKCRGSCQNRKTRGKLKTCCWQRL